MIIETIVTTLDPAGAVNIAPMGVEWDGVADALVIKPFLETTTFRNLRASGVAVVNLTDDVRIFAQGAIATAIASTVPAVRVRGVVLEAACSWREIEVVAVDDTPPRSRIQARVVHSGVRREFIGYNRAQFAVLEAAILATRTHLLPAAEIRDGFARLAVVVGKTAGPRERDAMATLERFIATRVAPEKERTRETRAEGGEQ